VDSRPEHSTYLLDGRRGYLALMDGQWADDQLTFATTTILCVESRDREVRAVGFFP
jgi:hypothetical protein